MHRDSVEWNLGRWGPTAPESRVLLDGAKGSGAEAFKLAVLESVARRILAVTGETDLSDKEAPTGLLHSGTVTRATGRWTPYKKSSEKLIRRRRSGAPVSA